MFLKRCGRNSHSLNAIKHRSTRPEVFCKKGVLKNFTQKFTGKYLCQSLFFNSYRPQTCNLIEKKTLAQVFSCEFCEISMKNIFHRTPLVAASVQINWEEDIGSILSTCLKHLVPFYKVASRKSKNIIFHRFCTCIKNIIFHRCFPNF